jgi:hypothetical protein
MTRITQEKGSLVHDDRLDGLAIGVGWFNERLSRDVNKEVSIMRGKAMDDLLRKKYAKAMSKKFRGRKPSLLG